MAVEQRKNVQANNSNNSIDDKSVISLKQIHDAIPAKLFERSTVKSFLYLIHDLILVTMIFISFYYLIEYYSLNYLKWPLIVIYWLVQGTVATGIWVIAHECGHQAFSPSQRINDTVGLILHSFLLTPYHSWKISHSKHHRSTGHMNKDMVFVPLTKREYLDQRESFISLLKHGARVLIGNGVQKDNDESDCIEKTSSNADIVNSENTKDINNEIQNLIDDEYLTDIPLLAFIMQVPTLIAKLLFGWPAYLLFNCTGQKYERWATHFFPTSPIFEETHKNEVIISNIGLITMSTLITIACNLFSTKMVFIYYFVPYLVVNAWLVLITYLHHTDPVVPHYRDGSWTYVKGALATIDRNYGFIINYLHHNIGDTHVAHHLFSKIPHYNAKKVTEIIKPLLGKHYNFDDTFFLKALWLNQIKCQYVPDEGEVLYFQRPNTYF